MQTAICLEKSVCFECYAKGDMYSREERAIIWLDIFDFLTYKKQEKILALFDDPFEMFKNFADGYQPFAEIISKKEYDEMVYSQNEQFLNSYILSLESQNIKVVTYVSEAYPKQFLEFVDKPFILYCKGDLSLLKTKCVGIVGSRKPTRYGKEVTEKFAKAIASSGVTVVSGLADGIDGISHRAALDVNGKTIAVMGGGFNYIYPKTNFALEREIEEKGLVITEYKPNSQPALWHYPIRNRIIAGLSNAVLITEASTKSGALYTRDYCIDYGIDLYAVPGEITSFSSSGCNMILKTCQASLVTTADDILDKLNVVNKFNPVVKNFQISFEEQTVLNAINGETHFDELQLATKLDTKTLITLLTTMELNGLIKKLAGNYYCK
jgi:DNA processing protein